MIYLVEIQAAVDAAGTLKTYYLSSGQFQTGVADAPPNINFISALTDPGTLTLTIYNGDGRTAGASDLTLGTLEIANADGAFDAMMDQGFDGRPVTIRLYQPGLRYADMPVLLKCTSDGPPLVTRQTVQFRLRDMQMVLDLPACPNLYGGTNVLPNGIDGTANDIKGQNKPRAWGQPPNVTPTCVNTSLQVFQVNDGAVVDIPAVYVNGAAYTKDSDYATNAALQSATIAAGHYATCFAEGLFRLNDALAGTITCDVKEGSSNTAAQVIKRIALASGLAASQISVADVATLDALTTAPVGVFASDGSTTYRDLINQVAAGVGAWAAFDQTGVLRLGRISSPSGTPAFTLTDSQDFSLERTDVQAVDLPVWRVQLNHTKNWTPQSTGIAGSVSLARQNFLKNGSLTWNVADATVKTQFLLAPTLTVDSLIYDPTPAVGGPADLEANRLLALYKVKRNIFQATVHLQALVDLGVTPTLMQLVQVRTPRFGFSAGKLFWVIGFELVLAKSQCIFTLWA